MANRPVISRSEIPVSEGRVSGNEMVFTDSSHITDKLQLSARSNVDGTVDYALKSPMVIDRHDLVTTLTAPLDVTTPYWRDVQDGLRKISYPSRQIRRLARGADKLLHLRSIQHDAGALAESMTQYDVATANIRIFTLGESKRYTGEKLRSLDRETLQLVVEQLFGIQIDRNMMRKWSPKQWQLRTPEQRQKVQDTFHAVLAGIEQSKDQMGNDDVLSAQDVLDCLVFAELESLELEAFRYLFRHFETESDYPRHRDNEDGDDPDIYIRNADIPPGAAPDKNTTIVLGRHLDPRSRKEPHPRRQVEFRREKGRRIVHPILRWTHDPKNDERRFRFGSGESHIEDDDRTETGKVAAYYSPIAGAAIAAATFGGDVDYTAALRTYLDGHRPSKGHAGLLPLVLRRQQDRVLNNAYIRKAEGLVRE